MALIAPIYSVPISSSHVPSESWLTRHLVLWLYKTDLLSAGERHSNGGPLDRSIVNIRHKMADLPPHREGPSHSSGNTFPTVGVSWDATAPSNLQRSLSPTPPGHHADIQQNTVVSDWYRGALSLISTYPRSVFLEIAGKPLRPGPNWRQRGGYTRSSSCTGSTTTPAPP